MTIQIGETTIRVAKTGDAPEIANVHINCWREAYRDLLPPAFLDDLPLSFKRRTGWWTKVIADPENYILFVAENKSGIVGFACFEAARDPHFQGYGEVVAIYLFEKFKGQKIGAALLNRGMQELVRRNFNKAYCWVLEHNPTIAFYVKSGATLTERSKDDEIGGKKVRELAYEWNNLGSFK